MIIKLESGEILAKDISSYKDIDDELVGHPDSIYNNLDQIERIKWLIMHNMKRPIMEIGTACGYVLNKLNGDIGIDIRSDRLLVAKMKYPDKKFCYGNILNLAPFYNTGINSVVISEILEHIPYDVCHHAIIHCLNVAPIVYYTVPNTEKDINTARNQEHKWYPTTKQIDVLMKLVNIHMAIDYNINMVSNFLCGIIKRI